MKSFNSCCAGGTRSERPEADAAQLSQRASLAEQSMCGIVIVIVTIARLGGGSEPRGALPLLRPRARQRGRALHNALVRVGAQRGGHERRVRRAVRSAARRALGAVQASATARGLGSAAALH